MGGHSTSCRQNSFCRNHSSQVFRRSLQSYQYRRISVFNRRYRVRRVEVNLSGRRSRGCRQSFGQLLRRLLFRFVKFRMQQLVDHRRLQSCNRRLLVDQTFFFHIYRYFYRRRRRTLSVSRLQHIQFVPFYREFHILHVRIMFFQQFGNPREFLIYFRERFRHLRNRLRRPDSRYHVFSLRIYQEFSEQLLLSVGRVSCEGHSRSRSVPHVSEYHGLYVYRRSDISRNIVQFPVQNRSLIVPRTEYRFHRFHQLFLRILRELPSHFFFYQLFIAFDNVLQMFGCQVHVIFTAFRFFLGVEDGVKLALGNLHHHVSEHLNESPVAVIGESRVLRQLCQPFHRLVV